MNRIGSKAGNPLTASVGRKRGVEGRPRPNPTVRERPRFDHGLLSLVRDHGVWYLRDRSLHPGDGKSVRRNFTVERYGPDRPVLFPPELRSGLAEDVLERLPEGAYDLVYLDPPYGETPQEWDRAPKWPDLAHQVERVLKPTGQAVLHISGGHHIEAAHAFGSVLQYRFHFVWIRGHDETRLQTGPVFTGTKPLPAHELIYIWSRRCVPISGLTFNEEALARPGRVPPRPVQPGRFPYFMSDVGSAHVLKGRSHKLPTDVIFIPPERLGVFSAAKPLELTRRLIILLSNPGDVVLDPYAGSGTTLRAAFTLGRRSLGVEASPQRYLRLRELDRMCKLTWTEP